MPASIKTCLVWNCQRFLHAVSVQSDAWATGYQPHAMEVSPSGRAALLFALLARSRLVAMAFLSAHPLMSFAVHREATSGRETLCAGCLLLLVPIAVSFAAQLHLGIRSER